MLAAWLVRARENIVLEAGSGVDALADSEGIQLDCLGGRLRPEPKFRLVPNRAALERMSFARVSLGAEDGVCEVDHAQTHFKELFISEPSQ